MDAPLSATRALPAIHELVGIHARELSGRLQAHRLKLFPLTAKKTLRTFSSSEVAQLIGVNDGYLRRLSLENKGPPIQVGRSSGCVERVCLAGTFSNGVIGAPV